MSINVLRCYFNFSLKLDYCRFRLGRTQKILFLVRKFNKSRLINSKSLLRSILYNASTSSGGKVSPSSPHYRKRNNACTVWLRKRLFFFSFIDVTSAPAVDVDADAASVGFQRPLVEKLMIVWRLLKTRQAAKKFPHPRWRISPFFLRSRISWRLLGPGGEKK